MVCLAFLISFLLGYLILKCFLPVRSLKMRDLFLIPGIGLAASAQIVFYSLLICNQIVPAVIIDIHLLCLLSLSFYHRESLRFSLEEKGIQIGLVALLLIWVGFQSAVLALSRPYGEWDGWSFWNYLAKFLFTSGDHWRRIFEYGLQAQHPWMLPCMVIWGWSLYGSENVLVPLSIGIIFTVSCIGLLVSALKEYISLSWAALAGVFLASIPVYMMHGTSQYADIILAYFILAVSISILLLLKEPTAHRAALTGILLGLMASFKDNGIVASVILFVLIILQLRKAALRPLMRPLTWGFVVILVPVILMKSLYALQAGNHFYDFSIGGLLVQQRYFLIGAFGWKSLFDHGWGMLWPLVLLVLLFFRERLTEGIWIILKFICLYVIFYLFIYAVTVLELKWLLGVTFFRLLYLFAPTVVFIMFYMLGKEQR